VSVAILLNWLDCPLQFPSTAYCFRLLGGFAVFFFQVSNPLSCLEEPSAGCASRSAFPQSITRTFSRPFCYLTTPPSYSQPSSFLDPPLRREGLLPWASVDAHPRFSALCLFFRRFLRAVETRYDPFPPKKSVT